MLSWLIKGAGANKTTIFGVFGIIGGLGLIFTGHFNEGLLMIFGAAQQIAIRWSKNPNELLLFQRTFWASLGGVFTGIYMVTQGNVGEGFSLLTISISALTQRQHNAKTA
jgi:hypothetical protein